MAARMKVAFAGTPEFAREALAAILAAGFDVPIVLTQPDRPAGRGMKLQASPVKQLAQQHASELGERIAEMQAMQRTISTMPCSSSMPPAIGMANLKGYSGSGVALKVLSRMASDSLAKIQPA